MDAKERDRIDAEAKKLRNQFGIDATVSRETIKGEQGRIENGKLNEIGETLNPMPDKLKYYGSAAFHIYYNETLRQIFFVNQAGETLKGTPESLTQYAVKDFVGTIMEQYGARRPKWRSGF